MIDDEWRPEAPLGGAGSDFASEKDGEVIVAEYFRRALLSSGHLNASSFSRLNRPNLKSITLPSWSRNLTKTEYIIHLYLLYSSSIITKKETSCVVSN